MALIATQGSTTDDETSFWFADTDIINKRVLGAIDEVAAWCNDNFDKDSWKLRVFPSTVVFYIKGNSNVIAFKLRWC